MDRTYLSRLSLRKQLLAKHPDVVRAVNIQHHDPQKNDEIRDAIYEWYAFVIGTYLPTRYPTMFRLLHPSKDSDDNKGTHIESLVTGLKVPADPGELVRSFCQSEDDAIAGSGAFWAESDSQTKYRTSKDGLLHLLDTLGSWVDEDFLILLPSPPSSPDQDQEPKYHLQAYATYFPSGFDTRTKLSKPLSEIHAPVPGYKQKLEKSMDRFFDKLEVGRAVLRVNWSIMTKGTGLFAAFGGLHDHSSPSDTASADTKAGGGEGGGDEEDIKVEGFDGDETYVRCERQTLHRLPKTKALVFAFHTYLYPIQDIKDEGLGEDLAIAIDGLKEGSVPGIYPYKRGPYWGEAVKAFLRA